MEYVRVLAHMAEMTALFGTDVSVLTLILDLLAQESWFSYQLMSEKL